MPIIRYTLQDVKYKFEFINPMSQMMQQTMRSQDYFTLQHIIQEADRKYLKQSRINKHPLCSNLNILRVLSSFKQIFPSTPEKIYKLLMFITKNHNPQTKEQWIRAIDKLQSIQIKQSRSQLSLLQQDSHFHTRSHSQMHKLKSSNYQNSIKTYKQELDQQIDSIESKRSRVKFVGDFRATEPFFYRVQQDKQNNMQLSNKNSLRNSHHAHYISFEPYHRQSTKQSTQLPHYLPSETDSISRQKHQMPKKINPYHQITRIDNLSRIEEHEPSSKDDSKTLYSQNYRTQQNSCRCIPIKTQRDFSKTRLIGPDSKDSQISIKTSHLARNQKFQEVTEYQFYNMTIDEWESLNEKASTFYFFNLKLKAFSAILANYQAFQHDRFLKDKARIFNSSYLESKVFIAFKVNVSIQKSLKQKFSKAQKFYNQSQYKKVWKVLQVIKNLKIQESKKEFQIQKLNKINYEFLMTFMFAQKSNFQNSPSKSVDQNIKQSFQFENKVEYFSRTQNFENLWEMYKCFGLNINISKEKLSQFFRSYHQCIVRRSFSVFKNHYQSQKKKYQILHETRLVQKVFSILLSKKQMAQKLKAKASKAQYFANKKLKQKTYKILLSIVYSTKIFSKRQEYIQSQKINRTKVNILKTWFSSYQNNEDHRKIQQILFNKMYQRIQSFIFKLTFRKVKDQSDSIQKNTILVSKYLQNSSKEIFFINFTKGYLNKRKFLKLSNKNEQNIQKNIIQKWLRIVSRKQSLMKLQKTYKTIIFRNLFVPITREIKQDYLLKLQDQKRLVKQCFQSWIQWKIRRSQNMKKIETQLKCYFYQNKSKSFLNILRINKNVNIMIRQKRELNQKQNTLLLKLNQFKSQSFLLNLKDQIEEKSNQLSKIQDLSVILKGNLFNHMITVTGQLRFLQSNSKQLNNYLKAQSFRGFSTQLKKNNLQAQQRTLKSIVQKKQLSNFLAQISQKCSNLKKLQQKSESHHKILTQRKVVLILANLLIDSTQKSHQLQKVLNKQRKGEYFKIFKTKTLHSIQQKSKIITIEKRQFFVCLRENIKFQIKKKQLRFNLTESKIVKTLESLIENVEISQQINKTQQLTNQLKKKQFWIRFNSYFIESLFQKKHSFMAYKFRALKLYSLAFRSWKKTTYQFKEVNNRSKMSNQLEKQKFFNHRQKQFKHMHRPTDCSTLNQ